MSSKRRFEGYFQVDHRASPGIPDEMMPAGMPARSGQGNFETSTYTCSHCPRIVVLNPMRRRERGYCRKCDKYICDYCTAALHETGICLPYKNFLDELQEKNSRLETEELSDGKEIIIRPNINAHGIR